jgi:hypothetical protein
MITRGTSFEATASGFEPRAYAEVTAVIITLLIIPRFTRLTNSLFVPLDTYVESAWVDIMRSKSSLWATWNDGKKYFSSSTRPSSEKACPFAQF